MIFALYLVAAGLERLLSSSSGATTTWCSD